MADSGVRTLTRERKMLNSTQRRAIQDAISVEEDWLSRSELERRKTGRDKDERDFHHERKLKELKEGLYD